MRLVLLVIALLTASSAGAQTKSGGGYTSAQASHGATVYTQSCVSCHGANLQGESAPALTGQIFRQAYGSGTAAQLYDFISRQMPQDKPASLSQQQYLDVTAYILARNGLAAGNSPLQVSSLGQVSLAGISSGAICAWTVAWERPNEFRKVLSAVGSFTNIRGGHNYQAMIRKTEKKPIRIFLQDGSGDLDNLHGNWPLANQEMAASLKFMGYDYKFEFGTEGHNAKHGGAILPDSLRWLIRCGEICW